MRIGTNELLIILVVALLIFGPKNLPKLGKMFGKTINGFKKGMEDEEGSDDSEEKANSQANEPDLEREQFRSRPLLSRATFLLHHFLAPSRTRAWF